MPIPDFRGSEDHAIKAVIKELRAGKKAKMLDFRLAQNDSSLLDEDGFIVTQMNAVPAGTRITHNAQVVMAPENGPQM